MTTALHQHVQFRRRGVSRRNFLHSVSASAAAAGMLSFRDVVSLSADELRKQGRSMILLWMQGAPSQFETFDPKPGTEEGGETKAIQTNVPGIEIAEHFPKIAGVADDVTFIRSMTNKEGNHQRATYQMHTGYIPAGSVKHPSLAANLAYRLERPDFELPSVVTIGRPPSGGTAGYLGVDYEPFVVNRPGQLPQNVAMQVGDTRYNRRLKLLGRVEKQFAADGAAPAVDSHQKLYGKAARMAQSPRIERFTFDDEPADLQQAYGDTQFGKGCLLARRLVETGVTFVEVTLGNWDMHNDLYERLPQMASQADPATAALIGDLKDRGLLDKTLVVWMGEFGRTPRINPRGGRDHYPAAFNALVAGGGVKGGQVIGKTNAHGTAVEDEPVSVADLFSSICHSLGVDPKLETISPLGRPMKIVDGGKVVEGLFA